jgi:hypothetical protein
MRNLRLSLVGTITLALLCTAGNVGGATARAAGGTAVGPGLVTGPEARDTFEALARDGAVAFTGFESVATGPHLKLTLDGPGDGIAIRLRTTEFRYPLPPKRAPRDTPVLVLPYGFVSAPANHRLMGSNPGDTPDGQAAYKLVLSKPVSHVGLQRMWNTYSLTRFYDADGRLLAKHRNTENSEFVGYVAHGPGDRVKSIEFDGVPERPGNKGNKIYQVGEVDDLFVGNVSAAAWSTREGEPSVVGEQIEAQAPSEPGAQSSLGTGQAAAAPTRLTPMNVGLLAIVVLGVWVSKFGVDYMAQRAEDMVAALFIWLLRLAA